MCCRENSRAAVAHAPASWPRTWPCRSTAPVAPACHFRFPKKVSVSRRQTLPVRRPRKISRSAPGWRPSHRTLSRHVASWNSASLSVLFRQRQIGFALDPVTRRSLYQLDHIDFFITDPGYHAEILAEMVAYLHAMYRAIRRLNDRPRLFAARQRADHLERVQRKFFERFLAPVQVRTRPAATRLGTRGSDILRRERIRQGVRFIGEHLVRLDLRWRFDPRLSVGMRTLGEFPQIVEAVAAATDKHDRQQYCRPRSLTASHAYFPPGFAGVLLAPPSSR